MGGGKREGRVVMMLADARGRYVDSDSKEAKGKEQVIQVY